MALQIAQIADPYDRILETHCAPEIRRSAILISTQPKLIKVHRHRAIRSITNLAQRLSASQQRLAHVLQKLAPARRLNIPLISGLLDALGHNEKTLPRDLTKGMLIKGDISHSMVLPSRVTPAATHVRALSKGLLTRNKDIIRSIARTCDPKLRENDGNCRGRNANRDGYHRLHRLPRAP